MQPVEDGEIVELTPEGAAFIGAEGERDVIEVDWDDEVAEQAGYETFMLKEIYEQPEALRETIGDRVRHGRLVLEGIGMSDDELRALRRIVIVACGTAYHAGVVGRYVIEEWARIPVEPDIASEWIYRNPVIDEDTLVIGISQSGETRDTIQAMQAREGDGRAHGRDHEHDGLADHARGRLGALHAHRPRDGRRGLEDVHRTGRAHVPDRPRARPGARHAAAGRDRVRSSTRSTAAGEDAARSSTGTTPRSIAEIAERHYDKPFFLFLGRHIGLPVALEGALKLKEISYIPTEAYSAGEMKHGPIALLDEEHAGRLRRDRLHVYDKIVSNIQETRARGAHVIAIATDGNEDIQHHANDVIYVPRTHRVPAGGAGDPAAPAARLPDRAPARPERRPAAQPREDRHRRVSTLLRIGKRSAIRLLRAF